MMSGGVGWRPILLLQAAALDLLKGLDLSCSVGIPYSGCVLKKWAKKKNEKKCAFSFSMYPTPWTAAVGGVVALQLRVRLGVWLRHFRRQPSASFSTSGFHVHLSHGSERVHCQRVVFQQAYRVISVRLAGGVGINKGTEQSLKDLENLPDQFLLSVSPLLSYDLFVPSWVAFFF